MVQGHPGRDPEGAVGRASEPLREEGPGRGSSRCKGPGAGGCHHEEAPCGGQRGWDGRRRGVRSQVAAAASTQRSQ